MVTIYNSGFDPNKIREEIGTELNFLQKVCNENFYKENDKALEFVALGALRSLSLVSMGVSLANIVFVGTPYLLLTGNAAYFARGVLAFVLSHDFLIVARNRCTYLENPEIAKIGTIGRAMWNTGYATVEAIAGAIFYGKKSENPAKDQTLKATLGYYLADTWSASFVMAIFNFGIAAKDYYQNQAAKT